MLYDHWCPNFTVTHMQIQPGDPYQNHKDVVCFGALQLRMNEYKFFVIADVFNMARQEEKMSCKI